MNDNPAPGSRTLDPEPLSVRIDVAARMLGLSRSKFYELLEDGSIESVRVGRARLVPVASLRAFLAAQAQA